MQNKVGIQTTVLPLADLYAKWVKLGDVSVSDGESGLPQGTIETSFLNFPAGTQCEEIWAWFEAQNPRFVVGEVMQGIRHSN